MINRLLKSSIYPKGKQTRLYFDAILAMDDVFKDEWNPIDRNDCSPAFSDKLEVSLRQALKLRPPSPPWMSYYLPIEFFKKRPHQLFDLKDSYCRTFYSSGTTTSERSLSRFSSDGLALYRTGAVKTFFTVLANFFSNPLEVRGISMIPQVASWPDSSLAQMVEWIGQYSPLSYANRENLKGILASFNDQPLWLFATGFHLVDLIDRGFRASLHPESVIIETGGTKGKSRDISRAEFYAGLERTFNITQNRIVSEYGMCEMASQAYDFVAEKGHQEAFDGSARCFRFPAWVHTFAYEGIGIATPLGSGSLLVFDPLRIDCPLPMRTQDFVAISSPGKFRYLGRVLGHILKGCSLNVEDILTKNNGPSTKQPRSAKLESWDFRFDREMITQRVQYLEARLPQLFRSHSFLEAFTRELSSLNLAKAAIQDLLDGMPKTMEAWLAAVTNALGNNQDGETRGHRFSSFGRWLIIPPRSHPQAIIYPLAIGVAAGLKLFVRTTDEQSDSVESAIIRLLQDCPATEITPLNNSFRIGKAPLPQGVQGILVFGSDATINHIRSQINLSVKGFGSHLCCSMVLREELILESSKIVADCFCLAQKGCFSSRFILVLDDDSNRDSVDSYQAKLSISAKQFIGKIDSSLLQTRIDQQYLHYHLLGAKQVDRQFKDEPIFPSYHLDNDLALIAKTQSNAQFVVPLYFAPSGLSPFKLIDEAQRLLPDLKRVLVSTKLESTMQQQAPENFLNIKQYLFRLGKSNAPPWDGYHCGEPLFCFEKCK